MSGAATSHRFPILEGLFLGPLDDVDRVQLAGTRCSKCNEVSLGCRTLCPNCGSEAVAVLPLAPEGILWTFTIVRHKPPGNYRGPDPFTPFGLGLVELPDGIRVMTPLECPVETLAIGERMRFAPYVRFDSDGREVVSLAFAPSIGG